MDETSVGSLDVGSDDEVGSAVDVGSDDVVGSAVDVGSEDEGGSAVEEELKSVDVVLKSEVYTLLNLVL